MRSLHVRTYAQQEPQMLVALFFAGRLWGKVAAAGPEAQAITIYFDVQGMIGAIHFDVSE